MKRLRIIAMGALAVGALCALLLWCSSNREQRAAKETRRTLRKQGFKTDLADFNFFTGAELRVRQTALTDATFGNWALRTGDGASRAWVECHSHDLLPTAGSNAAVVVWKQEKLPPYDLAYPWIVEDRPGKDLWSALREAYDEKRRVLDAACGAALSGPIRFNSDASGGSALLVPHLPAIKNLAQALGTRVVLELHDNNRDGAWTNLLAATRLVTAWEPEPIEASHAVRYACAATLYNATWQALQAGGWADGRLASLQREWESVDFLKGLPETAAFARASWVAVCQFERRQPLTPAGITLQQAFYSGRGGWSVVTGYWSCLRYRHHGTYEDEESLLLYYRDRELALRHAVESPTWLEMQQMPGVTNIIPYVSKYYSWMESMLSGRQWELTLRYDAVGSRGLLADAAVAEAQRRLVVVAIALERYRGRHRSYPQTLGELVPDLLPRPPLDFMDGRPLRYYPTGESFVLYSVGLDCADNGGTMEWHALRRIWIQPVEGIEHPVVLVWPRPTSVAELKARPEEEERRARLEAEQASRAESMTERTPAQLVTIARPLGGVQETKAAARPSAARAKELTDQGRLVSQLLRNEKAAGTNNSTLDEQLTVKRILAAAEPGIAIFEVPVSYEAVTKIGRIQLVVDGEPVAAPGGQRGETQRCKHASNGNCLLAWTTTPGRHAIQAELICTKGKDKEDTALRFRGPPMLFLPGQP